MSDDTDATHVYGAPDTNLQPPPEQGMRGEQGAPQGETEAGLDHAVTLEGRPVTVTETSGVAFAEITKQDGTEDAAAKDEAGLGQTGG